MGIGTLSHKKLEDLSDRDFRALVDLELRKDHPQTSASDREMLVAVAPKLRHPEVLERWIAVLETMKASSESQLGARRDELLKTHETIPHDEYLGKLRQFQGWRAGNIRFLNSVNSRLQEARWLKLRHFGEAFPTRAIEERNLAMTAYTRLLSAIEEHRAANDAFDPTEADLTLWSAITTEP